MKTKTALIVLSFISLVGVQIVRATVGGPTYIGNFGYNKADESIYYIVGKQDGRGCPPILSRISLETEKVSDALSCEEGEEIRGENYSNAQLVLNEIMRRMQGFRTLSQISLPKNDIQIDVKFIRGETFESDPSYVYRSQFIATVYQRGKKVDELSLTGCSKDQPFTFASYVIPGFEKKIVILSSTKSDCMEGGYTGEKLHVTGGVDGLDKTYTSSTYKSYQEPLVPSELTLVVFEKDTPTFGSQTATSTPMSSESKTIIITTIATIVALCIGLFLGKAYLAR